MAARRNILLATLVVILSFGRTTPLFAHPGHGGHEFADGIAHPFTGLDHLLAMVAVGILAVRIGGRAIWIMPCTFLLSMLAGGLIAACGVPLPGVEWGIAASVLVLGLLIAATSVIPLKYGALLVALFAAFHGHAHATQLVHGGSMAHYAAGFLLATALLHAGGIATGLLLARWLDARAVRLVGGLITIAGLLILCGIVPT